MLRIVSAQKDPEFGVLEMFSIASNAQPPESKKVLEKLSLEIYLKMQISARTKDYYFQEYLLTSVTKSKKIIYENLEPQTRI